jgi:CheY-like chemotaxis protein
VYTEREVKMAESFAERVATAVDNSQLYHEVADAGRQKDEFLAMLAHELRNPLAAIRYSVALGQMSRGEETGELLEVIDRQAENLARLIDDLLDVSRISRDKITLRKEVVDARAIVARAAAAARPLMEEKQHRFVTPGPGEPLPLYADPTRAEQILTNLLTNAAKYTPSGGEVRIDATAEDSEAVIRVTDTGVGLPAEMLTRVFDLFAQADRSLDRSEGGLGIGLTVARRLAEMHGGSVTAASEGLGRGSLFTVRLPMAHGAAKTMPTDQRSAASSGATTRRRVLVVDDNRDTARSSAKLLELLGHEVRAEFDGPGALAAAHEFQPEVMLLDIGLPGMTGYELVRRLRDQGFRDAIIVAVSGYGQASDKMRSREAGFDDHLVKPVNREALIAALSRVCLDAAADI